MGKTIKKKPLAVVAFGGNAMVNGEFTNASAQVVIDLIKAGYNVVITHGNGPPVGILMKAEPSIPLYEHVLTTQTDIGGMIIRKINDLMPENHLDYGFRCMYGDNIIVSRDDPAFKTPTKFVGIGYKTKSKAQEAAKINNYQIAEYSSTGEWKFVVPSPIPIALHNVDALREQVMKSLETDVIPIVCGGGGIGAIKTGELLENVNVVLDKDRTGALLAKELGADVFFIIMEEGAVVVPDDLTSAFVFNQDLSLIKNMKVLEDIDCADLEKYLPFLEKGSILPKVEAAMFAARNGIKTVITHATNFGFRLASGFFRSGAVNYGTVVLPDKN